MENLITQKVIVQCTLTPEQWGLDPHHSDSNEACESLNAAVQEIFNCSNFSRDERWFELYKVMKKYKRTGANNKAAYDRADAIFFEMR